MSDSNQEYARSKGIQLLEAALQSHGPIFSIDQVKPIAKAMQISDAYLYLLISSLNKSGWIEIIKRGTYVIKSPIYSGDISPFAIAAALVQPMAISHWSALAQHGFTTQNPVMVQASTPNKIVTPEMRHGQAYSPRGRSVWKAYGTEFEFIFARTELFWGFQKMWVNSWQQADITDPERTALDMIARPDVFGGIRSASELLEEALPQINIDRLVDYALKYNVGAVIKRLGWLLENMGVPSDQLISLRDFPVKPIYRLDTTLPKSNHRNLRWRVDENLKG